MLFRSEKSSVSAGTGGTARAVYLGGVLAWLVLALFLPQPALAAFATYAGVRGVFDPMRRSRGLFWWRGAPAALLLAPVCAICIDAGKVSGALAGLSNGNASPRQSQNRA